MPRRIILASGSAIRAQLLRSAGLEVEAIPPRIDEQTVKDALISEGASPRDIADTLAEMKARKVSDKHPDALVLGCDQVLAYGQNVFGKPETPEDAAAQLKELRGNRHMLLSAAVIYEAGEPIWRHVGQARLQMRDFSDAYLDAYLERNWHSIRDSVGGYKLEEEGVRLFARIAGDYFTILGLPMIELLAYLTLRGEIDG